MRILDNDLKKSVINKFIEAGALDNEEEFYKRWDIAVEEINIGEFESFDEYPLEDVVIACAGDGFYFMGASDVKATFTILREQLNDPNFEGSKIVQFQMPNAINPNLCVVEIPKSVAAFILDVYRNPDYLSAILMSGDDAYFASLVDVLMGSGGETMKTVIEKVDSKGKRLSEYAQGGIKYFIDNFALE